MKRIGIITLYNNNNNYGGMAQAYALQKYIENLGYECQVINYRSETSTIFGAPTVHFSFGERVINKIVWILTGWLTQQNKDNFSIRYSAMEDFRKSIPHTEEYVDDEVKKCLADFDVFVSGSDQIWKPLVVKGPFVLDFVPDSKTKISYGASIAQKELPDKYGKFMQQSLRSYKYISVREKNAQEYLTKLLERPVDWVVDPVLLLDASAWKSMAAKRQIESRYLFCYFLGESRKERKEAIIFAQKKGLKIVTLPHLLGRCRICDVGFGDIQLYDVGFEKFLSLIKNADYIFTDSFHAVVFSYIFMKNFVVFERVDYGSRENMISRVLNILELMGLKERFIDEATQQSILDLGEIDYTSIKSDKLQNKIQYSRKRLAEELAEI